MVDKYRFSDVDYGEKSFLDWEQGRSRLCAKAGIFLCVLKKANCREKPRACE
jgi:hypothetical protein